MRHDRSAAGPAAGPEAARGAELPVVLVGAGHAHLHVIEHGARLRRAGARFVLVEPGAFWYSGLATGMLGGACAPEEDRIDPAALVNASGGELVRDVAVGLDRANARVLLASGGSLPYSVVSFNVGSAVDVAGLEPLPDGVFAVKPIHRLVALREAVERRAAGGSATLRVLVVGGGATGCEVAANLDALARRLGARAEVTLVFRGPTLALVAPARARRGLAHALRRRGLVLRPGSDVVRVEPGGVVLNGGQSLEADLVVVATGLRPAALAARLGLPHASDGGLLIDAELRSVGDPRVFGAGDCAAFAARPLPKLGVFGVRQAPILLHNLCAAFTGQPLRAYRPQRRWLSIMNLGDGEALALWGPLWWRGRASLRLKDRLDRGFLARYRVAAPPPTRS